MSYFEGRLLRRGRVLIVDDSAFMRRLLRGIIEVTDDYRVVGEARTGLEAIRLLYETNPDIITLDLDMPDLNGLETLGYIMNESPRAVVIVSAQTEKLTPDALNIFDLGALEVVSKPAGDAGDQLEVLTERLLHALSAAARAQLRHLTPRVRTFGRPAPRKRIGTEHASCAVAVAASTGGPRALCEFVPALPPDFPCAVIVVQHMPAPFTSAFAERLNSLSALEVVEAKHGEIVRAGVVYVAPGGKHLGLMRCEDHITFVLTEGEPLWGVRPAADPTFRAVASHFGPASAGIVLTGMGRDGADGLRCIKDVGGWTAVEAESSAIIYGMPRSALPFADQQLSLLELAETLRTVGPSLCRRRSA
jgi:two-component system, chemotaxis family, protein-glutamate methylesterase/glutaminase